jgi:ATP-binding cassette subfamily B protein RaxB
MLDLYLGRLADITSAEPEDTDKPAVMYPRPLNGSIEVRSLAVRYAEGEAFIFENISFRVQAGDYVAVTGPSGQGKTTLIKILVGLLKPTKGQILNDGVPLIGVVMQDDHLLSGTIADNICFFDERFDLEQMTRCAMLAGLHDEIAQMPMAYNSLIGDMGTSLSGGQRQRLLLARALYKKPRILFMDEGTSNLDLEMERHVSRAIQGLGLTRVIVAHRTETINSAGRRLIMTKIGLREDSAEAALESASSNQEKAISRRGKVYH